MTLRIYRPSFVALAATLSFGSVLTSAQAGLEIIGQPPKVKRSGESPAARSPTRVQVFGNGEVKPVAETAPAAPPSEEIPMVPVKATAADYVEMMKKDAVISEGSASNEVSAPVSPREAARDASDTDEKEFESLRNRIRSRQVVEATSETVSTETYSPSARPRRLPSATSQKTKPAAAKTATGATPYPAARAMETEMVTPQAPQRGTKVPSARPVKQEAALEEDASESQSSGEQNAAFPYTHLLPSPFNIPQGSWVIGTTAAYGVFDFLQISTNVVRTINEQWNFQAKVPLIDYPTFMATAFVDYESFNPRKISDLNPDVRYKRWQPGLVTAYEINPDMAFFLGGNFNFGDDPFPVVRTSGYLKGARIEADWSWLYNPSNSRLGNNALSAGVTYDTTFSMFGFGVTHHWRSFSAGVHYTFADESRFLPIFGFNVGASF